MRPRPPKTHDLKCWGDFFGPIVAREKRFELRKDDGRDYRPGDLLLIREWSKKGGYSGREVLAEVTYLLAGFGLEKDWVCMSIDLLDTTYATAPKPPTNPTK